MLKKDIDKSAVALYLESVKRKSVFIACVLIIFYITLSQSGLTLLQTPMLTRMNALDLFPLVAIGSTIGLAIMTPIGGKIGDMIGRKKTILIAGIIIVLATRLLLIFQDFIPHLVSRVLLALGQGTLISVSYIIVGQTVPREQAPKHMGILSSALALGQFSWEMIAGFLSNANLINIAIIYPVTFILIGMALIAFNLPNIVSEKKVKFDIVGMLVLIITF